MILRYEGIQVLSSHKASQHKQNILVYWLDTSSFPVMGFTG